MNSETIIPSGLGRPGGRGGEPQVIGDILAELLAHYQDRFPEAKITVLDLPAAG